MGNGESRAEIHAHKKPGFYDPGYLILRCAPQDASLRNVNAPVRCELSAPKWGVIDQLGTSYEVRVA